MPTAKQRPVSEKERLMLERIRARLAELKMTWGQLAVAVGRSPNLGHQWSAGNSFPPHRLHPAIAEALKVGRAWLLTGGEPEEETKAQTVLQAEVLKLMLSMTQDQQKALMAAARGIAAHMDEKKGG
jgi:hypothetical protein